MVRTIVADDHAIVREGIALVLDKSSDFNVVAQVENGHELIKTLETVPCDLVLCDIAIPARTEILA